MNTLRLLMTTPSRRLELFWGALLGQLAGALAAFVLLGVLAGCGGGSVADAPTVAPAASVTTGFTQGAIGGFGSIFVNGVRFDDSTAQVFDDRGGVRTAQSLKLGMQVEVEHSAVDASLVSAKAQVVRYGEAVRGPVSAVDTAGSAITVLGQKVVISDSTVFDSSVAGRFSAITVGMVLEVHGVFDAAANAVMASRVERDTNPTSYKLRGTVTSLNTTAKTFSIGAAVISYAGVTNLPAALANGLLVRVELATTAVAGVWTATEVRGGPARPQDRLEAHVRGSITAFTSSASFSVNAIPVNAASASFPDGTTGLALGVMVEIEGVMTDGVLVANKVEIDARHGTDDRHGIALKGDITALNATAKTLVVKGTTVNYGGTVAFSKGTAADLAVGKKVEVRGVLATDGTTVQAVTIKFD